jgi:hypothetical protein
MSSLFDYILFLNGGILCLIKLEKKHLILEIITFFDTSTVLFHVLARNRLFHYQKMKYFRRISLVTKDAIGN